MTFLERSVCTKSETANALAYDAQLHRTTGVLVHVQAWQAVPRHHYHPLIRNLVHCRFRSQHRSVHVWALRTEWRRVLAALVLPGKSRRCNRRLTFGIHTLVHWWAVVHARGLCNGRSTLRYLRPCIKGFRHPQPYFECAILFLHVSCPACADVLDVAVSKLKVHALPRFQHLVHRSQHRLDIGHLCSHGQCLEIIPLSLKGSLSEVCNR